MAGRVAESLYSVPFSSMVLFRTGLLSPLSNHSHRNTLCFAIAPRCLREFGSVTRQLPPFGQRSCAVEAKVPVFLVEDETLIQQTSSRCA